MKLQTITAIKDDESIHDLCFLKDGRLVSSNNSGKIKIYKKNPNQSDIVINDEYSVFSVCALKNGNLASGGEDNLVKIREIGESDCKCIHTLKGHNDVVNKVIELEDGKLCSSSDDLTVKIWEKDSYNCIKTLEGHTYYVRSLIEMNKYVISTGFYSVRIWDKSTYECVQTLQDVYCCSRNGVSKLKDNAIIIGVTEQLFILDVSTFQSRSFQDTKLGNIKSICVLKEDKILIGNETGDLICFDSLSNQIIFTQKIHDDEVSCIIKAEDEKAFSASFDKTVKILEWVKEM